MTKKQVVGAIALVLAGILFKDNPDLVGLYRDI